MKKTILHLCLIILTWGFFGALIAFYCCHIATLTDVIVWAVISIVNTIFFVKSYRNDREEIVIEVGYSNEELMKFGDYIKGRVGITTIEDIEAWKSNRNNNKIGYRYEQH